jgi:hypothetical protein
VSQEIVGAPHGGSAQLECQVEAWPKAIVYWVKGSEGNVLLAGKKHSTKTDESGYISRITLGIQGISRRDFGTYKCMAKNALGEAEVAVKLHGEKSMFGWFDTSKSTKYFTCKQL